jgi:hypothetical protein
MGQNLRKTPKTIWGFIIYLTISLKNSFLPDIEDRIHQPLIAYSARRAAISPKKYKGKKWREAV